MKKIYKLEDLDCANCAAKMERAVAKIEGVASIHISFITQKMTIEIDNAKVDEIMREVIKTCKRIEPDCTIIL
ncbi:MAG: cation transporter [Bacilli bacterium]|jgi:hypothetical protein